MDKGYLIVSVYTESISQPISDATVRVTGDNYDKSFTTDINGKTNSIELDAPLKKYSLIPQKEVRPYSIYTVEVSKTGFETTTINGVEVLPGETSLQNIFLKPAVSSTQFKALALTTTAAGNVINLPPHSLWEGNQSTTSRNNIDDIRVYPRSLIPEYIIVHDGAPTDTNVANYYVSFPDYLKNVASSEIYSTWPIESIKANIHAIASFALNRLVTEWYNSQGYNFTITSSPKYDQTYIQNRTIFKTISDAVDQIFYYYIQLPDKNYPFFAQYDDGITVNNPGWLSQWGSKTLADQGYTAIQILKNYYVTGLTLETAEGILGLPTSFPGYNLNIGSCGEPVQKIQIMINTISGSYPAIPKIIPADGQYKDNTANSIKIFQQTFGLPITGIVDFATWYKISYTFVAISKMLQGIAKS